MTLIERVRTAWPLTLIAAALGCAAGEMPPNVIVILVDDLGYADVGFNGSREIRTPNIDRLAKQGVRFTNAYVTHPFCSPSRAGLLTGRYSQRFGHENNPEFDPENEIQGLPVDQLTLAEALEGGGYVSAMIGKWHLGAAERFHPLNRGFSFLYGFLSGGHRYFPNELTVLDAHENPTGYRMKLLRDRKRVDESEYLTDTFSREAVSFVERSKDRPFFLYLSYNAPHTPLQATNAYLGRYPRIRDKKRQTYAAMVSAIDDGVGHVLDAIEKHGLDERTLVFFLSDNGGSYAVNSSKNDPLRDGKGSLYEGGIRVPFAMRWTGRIPGGEIYHQPISSLDIFPTALTASGVKAPANHQLDGVDLLPFLTGEREGVPHDALYWRLNNGESFAVRRGPWKLVEPRGGQPQLYDVSHDRGERVDLAEKSDSILAELQALKHSWNRELVPARW